jgi:hypothetical protein
MTWLPFVTFCLGLCIWAVPAGANPPVTASAPPPSPELIPPPVGRSEPVRLHPSVVLRDDGARSVLESEKPVSPLKTCGHCHDAEWISRHSYHASLGTDERTALGRAPSGRSWDFGPGLFGRWDALGYSVAPFRGDTAFAVGTADWLRQNAWRLVGGGPSVFAQNGERFLERADTERPEPEGWVRDPESGAPRRWNWRDSGVAEMNCFLCHVSGTANRERIAELGAGRFGWAATATLSGIGLFVRDGAGWRPVREAFTESGAVKAGLWQIRPPTSSDCGTCHGVVHDSTEPLVLSGRSERDRMTETEGVVFSSQRISQSAMNIAGKEALTRPWDVHAERMVACHNCHFAPNHPAYALPKSQPTHLAFDARRLDLGEYLLRPDHRFAGGPALGVAVRRCESCHDAPRVHGWLPRVDRHLSRLACESCHIPRLFAPARAETDWSMLVRPGEPRVTYRGSAGAPTDPAAFVEGYRPALLPRRLPDGTSKLAPFNLMTTWYWVAEEGGVRRPVPRALLDRAFFREGRHHPDLVRVLDRNGDGRLDQAELVLDTAERVALAARRLSAEGAARPELVGEIEAYAIHHGVGPGRFATRECRACHHPESRVAASFELGEGPYGVFPVLVGNAEAAQFGTVTRGPGGRLAWVPDTDRAKIYLFGHGRMGGIDGVGLGAFLLVLIGTSTHGAIRWRTARRSRKETTR